MNKKRTRKKSRRTVAAKKTTVKPWVLDIIFVVALMLAVFLFLGIRHLDEVQQSQAFFGIVGTTIVRIIGVLCGNAAMITPLIFLAWALHILFIKKVWSLSMWGVVLLGSAILSWNSGYRIPIGMTGWEAAGFGMGGGYIGAIINALLHKLFGNTGAVVVLILLFLLAVILIIQKSVTYLLLEAGGKAKVITQDLGNAIFETGEVVKQNQPSSKTASFKMPPLIAEPGKDESKKEANGKTTPEAKPKPEEMTVFVLPADAKKTVTEETGVKEQAAVLEKKLPKVKAEETEPPVQPQYIKPGLELLNENEAAASIDKKGIQEQIATLEQTFQNFNLSVKVNQVSCGPSVTRFELVPAPGTKVSKIHNLSDDLQLSLASKSIRIEAPIPGKSAVGIEVPSQQVRGVSLRGVLGLPAFTRLQSPLAFALGEDIAGNAVVAKLSDMPHLLIAGSTGSGKSVCLNGIIMSLLFNANPEEVKFIFVDPKMVELTVYNGLPHLMTPVVTDPKRAAQILRWMTMEMEKRYKLFSEAGVRDVYRYREVSKEAMPFIVIIIDELADLMMVAPGEVEDSICRLAQMARAAGIHLIVATQRPSVDVVTGIIKANIPSRIAFAVSSQMDSRTILDMGGAEKLLGKGDMLFLPVGANKPYRIQGAFVSDQEIERTVSFIVEQVKAAEYSGELENLADLGNGGKSAGDDDLLAAAVQIVVESQKASASMLQRKLKLGYSRAARLMDLMEEQGIVSPLDHSNKRKVLFSEQQYQEWVQADGADHDPV